MEPRRQPCWVPVADFALRSRLLRLLPEATDHLEKTGSETHREVSDRGVNARHAVLLHYGQRAHLNVNFGVRSCSSRSGDR